MMKSSKNRAIKYYASTRYSSIDEGCYTYSAMQHKEWPTADS